jgi:hypothetical protein
MTTVGQTTLQIALAVIFLIAFAYSAGRLHQWYRRTFERETAYREGYNQASLTLFPLAVRKPQAKAQPSRAPAVSAGARVSAVIPFPQGQRQTLPEQVGHYNDGYGADSRQSGWN